MTALWCTFRRESKLLSELTHSGYVSKHSAVARCAAARSATG